MKTISTADEIREAGFNCMVRYGSGPWLSAVSVFQDAQGVRVAKPDHARIMTPEEIAAELAKDGTKIVVMESSLHVEAAAFYAVNAWQKATGRETLLPQSGAGDIESLDEAMEGLASLFKAKVSA